MKEEEELGRTGGKGLHFICKIHEVIAQYSWKVETRVLLWQGTGESG